jgi:RNA polymerase sigma factor (TIGR02999 family)
MTPPIEEDRGESARGPGSPAHGEPRPARELLPLVYYELRRQAAQRMAHESPGQTLQATALVHEAYLRLVGGDPDRPWDGRGHFFAAAAEAMRRILVESARRRHRLNRGGRRGRVDLDDAQPAAPETDDDLLALDEALEKLAARDPVQAQLVQLRVFAGLTLAEAAEILGLSASTADRYWAYARAWHRVEIADQTFSEPYKSLPLLAKKKRESVTYLRQPHVLRQT